MDTNHRHTAQHTIDIRSSIIDLPAVATPRVAQIRSGDPEATADADAAPLAAPLTPRATRRQAIDAAITTPGSEFCCGERLVEPGGELICMARARERGLV